MFRRRTSALIAASAVVLISAGPAVAGIYTRGSSGAGDPFFPLAGNGGYDVSHYSLTLGYEPASKQLTGTASSPRPRRRTSSRFDLDLRGFSISRLDVERPSGSLRACRRPGAVITPSTGLRVGRAFTVSSTMPVCPDVVTDPDGSIEGWVPTDDGAFVVGEPQGSPAWYPVNDNPARQGDLRLHVTVPEGLTVMANGVLVVARGRREDARPGSGESATRWLRTWRRRPSGAST